MKILNKKKGFTLIELLVTALIFSVVMGASTGVFLSAIKLQRYNLAHQQLLNQVGYAVECMDRAIRMATKDEIGCIDGSNYLETANSVKFATYHGQCWRFFLENEQLKIDRDGTEYDLTSDDFEVIDFDINVIGDDLGDYAQPRVKVSMNIKAKGSGDQPRVRIQTIISQRNLDL